MTEDEWLTATDPLPMVDFLRDQTGSRKLRLVGCACASRVVPAVQDDRLAALVGAAERAADGVDVTADVEQTLAALRAELETWPQPNTLVFGGIEHAALRQPSSNLFSTGLIWFAAARAWEMVTEQAPELDDMGTPADPAWHEAQVAEHASQASLLRDIFGNPFRAVAFDPTWRTEAAVALARNIYDIRQFDAAPVLADALEDAGCDDARVMGHLRGGGQHVRGCWVVDGVLGRK